MSQKCVYIDFIIDDGSGHSEMDACCKISTEIGATGLKYGYDFWFHDAYPEDNLYVLKFGFKDKHEAMLIKLAGIQPDNTVH